jgi:hypothetical protein
MRARELLAARAHAVAGHLDEVLRAPIDDAPAARSFAVTGGGLSEGPARFLAALLEEDVGVRATYAPLSEFAARAIAPPREDALVLFSQGWAPNARLPLVHAERFGSATVFTSVRADAAAPSGDTRRMAADAAARGVRVVRLPPDEESGLLLRVIGPPVCALAGARFAAAVARSPAGGAHATGGHDWARAPELHRAALARPAIARLAENGRLAPIALVTAGRYARFVHGLRWKLLEGLHVPDPPVWDLLQIAHGPLQSFYRQPMTLIALEQHGVDYEAPALARLERVLVPGLHRLIRLRASVRGPLAYFEHDALLDRLVLDALDDTGIDLAAWPAQGQDGPLYDIAEPLA